MPWPEEQPVTTKLDLSPFFDKGAEITVYSDDALLVGKVQTLVFKSKGIAVSIPKNGAFVVTSTSIANNH